MAERGPKLRRYAPATRTGKGWGMRVGVTSGAACDGVREEKDLEDGSRGCLEVPKSPKHRGMSPATPLVRLR
mgnify:CR=1 FL=1